MKRPITDKDEAREAIKGDLELALQALAEKNDANLALGLGMAVKRLAVLLQKGDV